MKYLAIVLSVIFLACTICVIIVDHGKQIIPFCVGLSACSILMGAGVGRSLK